MYLAKIARKASFSLFILLFWLCWLSACASGPASSTQTTHSPVSTQTVPVNASGLVTPTYTVTLPDEGVAASIPAGPEPDITVEGGSALQLTFVGSDAPVISTDLYALPYKKKGNTVLIDFGQTIAKALEIKIPREANLTVNLADGNVIVDTIQGQVNVTLTSGTIRLKNFTPRGTDALQTKSGTIDVTFAKDASCKLTAQTDFGAITSGYAAIKEQRSGMRDQASGTLSTGSKVSVTLTVGSGSITIGPA